MMIGIRAHDLVKGSIDEVLSQNGKNRQVSMFGERPVAEYFGDVYALLYEFPSASAICAA